VSGTRGHSPRPSWRPRGRRSQAAGILLACLLGVGAALLVSCGSSGGGLIPSANAGPLQSDFDEVAQAAQNGDGSCAATEAAIAKTERDYQALPAAVDSGLRGTLRRGIANLRVRALALCVQPSAQTTATTTTAHTTTSTQTSTTTPTVTGTTTTQTAPTTTSAPPTTVPGGGTPAPGGEGEAQPGAGNGQGGGAGGGEGSGSGGTRPGQEGQK
jgi:hypothetical protein